MAAVFGICWNTLSLILLCDAVLFKVMFALPLCPKGELLDSVMLFFGVSVSGKFEAVISQINGILGILSPF